MDLVEWLVTHPTERDQLSSIVEQLVTASEDLLKPAPRRKRAALRMRILDHLWCDLVASVVCAVEVVGKLESITKDKLADVVADTAVKLLAEARVAEEGKPATKLKNGKSKTRAELDVDAGLSIESTILKGCVRGVVKIALDGANAAFEANLRIILLKLRVAALMLCPDVMVHELVWKHCWLPMWHDAVFDAALEELTGFVDGLKPSLDLMDGGSPVRT
ncbi:hypothetical protein J2Y69_000209 [Microbacterium resistens]|uniref:Uncharacterized protein n=1 Tax=Microbacterium resistens TaxID=156977 RepID=A0ABU1S9Y4_9MICO|nr:hypothetical protein [Microbacterium resistens]MDR6865627.1 hypothetical protein [Microbacterium resistens]